MLFQRFADEYIEALGKAGLALTYLTDCEKELEILEREADYELTQIRDRIHAVRRLRARYESPAPCSTDSTDLAGVSVS